MDGAGMVAPSEEWITPRRYLGRLHEAGVRLYAVLLGGWHDLSIEDAIAFEADPEVVAARLHDLSPEHYQSWAAMMKDPHCTGRRRTGARCKQPVWVVRDPTRFEPCVSDRCRSHVRREAAGDMTGCRKRRRSNP
jgi:hypothetical protein